MSITLGKYQSSYFDGDDIMCVREWMLKYISNLVVCNAVVSGRYLTIHTQELEGRTKMDNDYLELCEVEIFGTGKHGVKRLTTFQVPVALYMYSL